MSLNESPLEWPRFCYTGLPSFVADKIALTPVTLKAKRQRVRPVALKGVRRPQARGVGNVFQSTAWPLGLWPQQPQQQQTNRLNPFDCPETFAFSNLMKTMAKKYENVDKDNAKSQQQQQQSPETRLHPLHPLLLLSYPRLEGSSNNLFGTAFTKLAEGKTADVISPFLNAPTVPLDLSSGADGSYHGPLASPSTHLPVEEWSIDDVCDFVAKVDSEYAQMFREHSIDGSSLSVLSERHLTGILGMRLGPAIRLLRAISDIRHEI